MYIGDGFAFAPLRGLINISKQALVGKLPLELGYVNFHVIVYNLVATNTNTARVLLACLNSQPSSKGWDALGRVAGLCNKASFKENQGHIKVLDRYIHDFNSDT